MAHRHNDPSLMMVMVIQVVKLSSGGEGRGVTKLERFLPKNQHTRRKVLNFENWCWEVSKIGYHFRK